MSWWAWEEEVRSSRKTSWKSEKIVEILASTSYREVPWEVLLQQRDRLRRREERVLVEVRTRRKKLASSEGRRRMQGDVVERKKQVIEGAAEAVEQTIDPSSTI